MSFIKSLYLQARFFYFGVVIVILFGFSYFFPFLFFVAKLCILIGLAMLLIDIIVLYAGQQKCNGHRNLPKRFSNGDPNTVSIHLNNNYSFPIKAVVIDELPEQFQKRDFFISINILAKTKKHLSYTLKPKTRGQYHFGKLNVYVSSRLNFVARRHCFNADAMVPTYPSFKQLKAFELINVNKNSVSHGVKKIRRLGHTMEFEQIKDYVLGDDLRTINWKATAKRNTLMVNQFQDEKSQPVYSILDKGRVMQMPFQGLSLLDYAINSALVISNVVLKKQDKAGVLSFSKHIENAVLAERKNGQMRLIIETLYHLKTNFFESDFSYLYTNIKQYIKQRSLLFIYTNFETLDGLKRQLPYLKALAKQHMLVIIFFKNTELDFMITSTSKTIKDVYDKAIAEKFNFEKRLIVSELKKNGIYSILTTPVNLTIDTINKYLAIKARGLF